MSDKVYDPRWGWFFHSLCRLYNEAEPGDRIHGIAISLIGDDGQCRQYLLCTGMPEIQRHLVPQSAYQAAHEFSEATINLTPDGEKVLSLDKPPLRDVRCGFRGRRGCLSAAYRPEDAGQRGAGRVGIL